MRELSLQEVTNISGGEGLLHTSPYDLVQWGVGYLGMYQGASYAAGLLTAPATVTWLTTATGLAVGTLGGAVGGIAGFALGHFVSNFVLENIGNLGN